LTKITKVLTRKTWIWIGIGILLSIAVLLYFILRKPFDPFDVDISDVELELSFVDLNKELKSSDSLQLLKLRDEYKKNNSEILEYVMAGCLGIDVDVDSIYVRKTKDFFSYKDIQQIEQGTQNITTDEKLKGEITDAFKRLKIHHPSGEFPRKIIFANTCFCVNAIVNNQPTDIPIGAFVIPKEKSIIVQEEKYIGGNLSLLQMPPLNQFVHNWTTNGYKKEYLKRDVVEAWLEQFFFPVKKNEQADVIHEAVRYGKILYFLHAAFPNMAEEQILRYDRSKLDWSHDQEKAIWSFLVENELLFQSSEKTIMNLFSEGPFTPNLEKDGKNESPDRIGKFIGFRMVQEFMKENASEDFKLDKLMSASAEQIYKSYKP